MCKRSVIGWVDGKVSWNELLKIIKNKLTSLKSRETNEKFAYVAGLIDGEGKEDT